MVAKDDRSVEADWAAAARSWDGGARRVVYQRWRGAVSGRQKVVIARRKSWAVVSGRGGGVVRRRKLGARPRRSGRRGAVGSWAGGAAVGIREYTLEAMISVSAADIVRLEEVRR